MLVHSEGSAKSKLTKVDSDMVQMHALDIRVHKIYKVLESTLDLTANPKSHRKLSEVKPMDNGQFFLTAGMYIFDSFHNVKMEEGEAGWIVPRSTFTRNGILVGSALYDAGYEGGVNGYIHNPVGNIKMSIGEKIGQFIVAQAETLKLYDGQYQGGTAHVK